MCNVLPPYGLINYSCISISGSGFPSYPLPKYGCELYRILLRFTCILYVYARIYCTVEGLHHRRRIELEDKAKVVASDWGTESLPR